MSKYHKGDKFIVEIKEVINSDNGTLYRSDFKTLTFDDNGLDKLQKYEEVQIPYSEAYNKGLEDAWELAHRLNNMTLDEIHKVYGFSIHREEVFSSVDAEEALAKLEAYEKEQNEIKVGDVVTVCGEKGIVVGYLCELEEYEVWMDGYERPQRICKNEIKKTGKHIDIQSLLEQIKE